MSALIQFKSLLSSPCHRASIDNAIAYLVKIADTQATQKKAQSAKALERNAAEEVKFLSLKQRRRQEH